MSYGSGQNNFTGASSVPKNGLSLDANGNLVLGNDFGDTTNTGQLTSNRQIFYNGYSLSLVGGYVGSNRTTFAAGQIDVIGNGGANVYIDNIEVYGVPQVKITTQSVVSQMFSNAGADNTVWFPSGVPVPAGSGFVNVTNGGQYMNFGNLHPDGGGVRYYAGQNGDPGHKFYNVGTLCWELAHNGNAYIYLGGIVTAAPSAAGAGVLQVGKIAAAAVTLDAGNYLEILIDGVVKKLALVN